MRRMPNLIVAGMLGGLLAACTASLENRTAPPPEVADSRSPAADAKGAEEASPQVVVTGSLTSERDRKSVV